MTALGTAFFAAMAVGLLVESAVAWRSRRVLRGREAAFAYGVGALGVVTVLSSSVGPQHDGVRRVSGLAVALAFLGCAAIDVANRRRVAVERTTTSGSA